MTTDLLAFCVSEKVGGGERFLLEMLSEVRTQRSVLLAGTSPQLAAVAQKTGIPYVSVPLGPKLGRESALRSLRSFRQQRRVFDQIVRDAAPKNILLQYKLEQLLWGGRDLGCAALMLEHGPVPSPILRLPFVRQTYRRSLQNAHAVWVASAPAADDLMRLGISSEMLKAGTRVGDCRATAPHLTRAQILSDMPGVERLGVFAGRLEPTKGVLKAINLTLGSASCGLLIAGSGSLQERISEIANNETRINYFGFLEDTSALIESADFGFLLSSDPGEGRPLFVLECAALGKPVLATRGSRALEALATELPPGYVIFDEDVDLDGVDFEQVPRLPSGWSAAVAVLTSRLVG